MGFEKLTNQERIICFNLSYLITKAENITNICRVDESAKILVDNYISLLTIGSINIEELIDIQKEIEKRIVQHVLTTH